MRVAYIIGPYRAASQWEVHKNIQDAERIAAVVARCGVFPYCPHKNTAYFEGLASDDLWLKGNLELIRRGIADFAIVSWRAVSSGSRTEIALFNKLELPVFDEGNCENTPEIINMIQAFIGTQKGVL